MNPVRDQDEKEDNSFDLTFFGNAVFMCCRCRRDYRRDNCYDPRNNGDNGGEYDCDYCASYSQTYTRAYFYDYCCNDNRDY